MAAADEDVYIGERENCTAGASNDEEHDIALDKTHCEAEVICDGELANGSFDDRGDFGDVTMLQSCTTAFDAATKPSKSLIAKRLRQQNRKIE